MHEELSGSVWESEVTVEKFCQAEAYVLKQRKIVREPEERFDAKNKCITA